ncbi:MAG: M48 family metalloprotease, partial [Chloroflexota bacterium]|nr:M48 family metalloprotease [Chloroflexota bacterium]
IAHIVNGDVKVLAIANFFVMLSSFLMQMFFWNMIFGGMGRNRDNGGGAGAIFILYIATMIVYFIGQLLVLALTRYREFGADYTGSNISGEPIELASALRKISISSISIPSQDLRQFKTANAFMIIPALSGDDISRLMSTHPPVEDRIRRLVAMVKQSGN